jgi:ubiquinone/menaquinone biosynthesis C-methylase UbiE
MNEFDIKAAGWDENPVHVERSSAIANVILENIPLNTGMVALEYGAGTGLSAFLLRNHLGEITLMDNSDEMVRIMRKKIKDSKTDNLRVLKFDLEHKDYRKGKFDLIFTQMVLHHVADIDTIFRRFRDLLNKGGFLAIADLYEEDGSFHGEGFTGHKGFDPEKLASMLKKYNFSNISHRPCFTINKMLTDTETKPFGLFLLTAVRD